jgi:hypothetical protein
MLHHKEVLITYGKMRLRGGRSKRKKNYSKDKIHISNAIYERLSLFFEQVLDGNCEC